MEENKTIHGQNVYGIQVSEHTGCLHYASVLDIVAIKFKCCKRYYACYFCHLAMAAHSAECWHCDDFHTKGVLCGHCGIEMSIHQYLSCKNECLNCKSPFNPKCKLHWDMYFSIDSH